MRKAGILARSESPTPEEVSDALVTLNDIIGSLSNDGLLVYAHTLENFNITGGTGSYTIGSGGDFDTTRPLSILSMYTRDSGGTDQKVSQIGNVEYSRISTKGQSGRPDYFYYDNGYSLGTIYLSPVPDTSYTLYINSEKPITGFSTLTTEFDLPPGWGLLLIDALVISLCPEYGLQASQEVLLSYQTSLSGIRHQRARMTNMDSSLGASQSTIYTGWNR